MYRLASFRVPGSVATAAAGVVLVGLLLAACVGGGVPAGSVSGENKAVASEVLGTGSVKVALLLPLSASGNAGQIAKAMRNAAELALKEFQTAQIQILVKDDRGTADGARAAASQAISEGAELILGPLFAQSVAGAASVAKAASVPVIAFSTDSSNASKGVYLLSFLPQTDTDRIVRYAGKQGKRSFAALLPVNAYGTVAEAALQKAVAGAGGRVMVIERYDLDKTSMEAKATGLAGIAQQGTIDTIFMPDGGDAAPFLAGILAAKGVRGDRVKFLGSGQWDDARVTSDATLNGSWFPAPDKAGYNAFAQRYQAAYGAAPFRSASLAYDAVSLAAGLTSRFGQQRFKESTLTNPSGFIGIDGAFRFLPSGLNERGLAIYQIQGGGAQIVDPAPKSFARGPAT